MISTLAIRAKLKRYAETGDLRLAAELLTHMPMLCETVDVQRDLLDQINLAVPMLQAQIDELQKSSDDMKATGLVKA